MNEFQKKRICELRADGCGYKLIAAELGISRDVVRNFCKKNKLNGYLSNMDKNIRKTVFDNALCLNCRTPIKQPKRGKARKYCSHECYIKNRFGGKENGI